ncbi:LysR family transcriptional regulator [Xanthomonas indica]|uniref:LysR family transcriptional regulator n=1 Tax=Xanthomonas indica TaxID=2912242 RepID=A0AAU8I5Z2_9XANT|nr:LysR family transcriptional regulator [Xanthomonas indica]MCI2263559.1 LysR substrate-binding domain-containing protein [Xanthomonas indica]
MPEPDLNLLIALDALLAEASVAGAARRLGLSASAMSRTLTRLREATGDALLVRAGGAMVATPHALQLRERARDAVEAARAVLRPAPAALELAALQRTFIVRANDAFVEAFAAMLVAAVAASAPQVRLQFVAKAQKIAAPLREGLADLEIGVLSEMGPELRVQGLFRDRFVGAVRSAHPLARDGEVSAQRYVAFGHVVASRRGRAHGPVDAALQQLGLVRHVATVVPSFSAALAVARHSDLIALVPASFMAAQPDTLRAPAHTFALPVVTAPITVSMLWHPRLEHDAAHRWLRGLVLTEFRARMPLR